MSEIEFAVTRALQHDDVEPCKKLYKSKLLSLKRHRGVIPDVIIRTLELTRQVAASPQHQKIYTDTCAQDAEFVYNNVNEAVAIIDTLRKLLFALDKDGSSQETKDARADELYAMEEEFMTEKSRFDTARNGLILALSQQAVREARQPIPAPPPPPPTPPPPTAPPEYWSPEATLRPPTLNSDCTPAEYGRWEASFRRYITHGKGGRATDDTYRRPAFQLQLDGR